MSLACRVHWSWVDRTGETVKQSQRRVTSPTSKIFRQHLKCSLTAPRRAGTSFWFFLFLFTQPAVWAWETWYSVVGPASRLYLRHDLQRLWYLADGRLLFIFNLSNAESRRTWKGWRTFAWMNCQAVVWWHWLFFFQCLRGGEDSERGETKFSAGVTVTAPTTMHAEERQHECSQRHSEVRAGRLSSRFRLRVRAYRTVQTRPVSSRSVHHGIFPDVYFYTHSLAAAARTAPNGVKERASFCLVFRSLNTTSSHRMFSKGYRRAKSTQGNTNFQKRIFWQTTSGSLPAGLKSMPKAKFWRCQHCRGRSRKRCQQSTSGPITAKP